jgi:hypothetical protein
LRPQDRGHFEGWNHSNVFPISRAAQLSGDSWAGLSSSPAFSCIH